MNFNELDDQPEPAANTASARTVLKGLLRSLEEVKRQRSIPHRPGTHQKYLERQMGELNGLDIAIAAVKRRLGP